MLPTSEQKLLGFASSESSVRASMTACTSGHEPSYGALGGSGDGGGADGGKLQTAPASYSSKSHEPPEAVTYLHSWISVLCSFFQR